MQVPVYEPDQVRLGPATAAKARPVGANAFGENVGRGLQQVARSVDAVADYAAREAELSAETAAKDLDNQLAAYERETLFTGDAAYFKQQGRNALLARPGVEKSLAEKQRELGAKANSPRAAELFNQVADRRMQSSLDRIATYATRAELDDYLATSEARVTTAADYAGSSWSDPDLQKQQLATGEGEVYAMANRLGWSADVTKARIEQFRSTAHDQALTEIIASDPTLAEDYFAAHGDELTGKTRAAWSARIKPAADQDKALKAGMAAWTASGGDLQAALAAVGGSKDLTERQIIQAQEVIKGQHGLAEQVEDEGRETLLRDAYAKVNAGQHPALLPPETQRILADQMDSLNAAWKSSAEAKAAPRNSAAYLAMRTLAVDEPEVFKQVTTPELVALGIHPEDIDKLIGQRDQMKSGKGGKSDLETGYERSVDIVITKSGGLIGTANPKAKTRLAEARSSIFAYLEMQKAAGHPIDDAMIKRAADLALVPRFNTPTGQSPTAYAFESKPGNVVRPSTQIRDVDPSLWNTAVGVAKSMSKDGTATNGAVTDLLGYYEATGYKAMVPYRDISRENRDVIVKWLKTNRMPVNEASIEQRYTAIILSKTSR